MKTLMIASTHYPDDGRIVQKIASSLKKRYCVDICIPDNLGGSGRGVVRLLRQYPPIIRRLAKLDCDIYHSHDPDVFILTIPLKLFGKRLVYDVHEHYPTAGPNSLHIPPNSIKYKVVGAIVKLIESVMVHAADEIIVVNDSVRDHIAGYGRDSSVVHNFQTSGIDRYYTDEKEPGKVVFVSSVIRDYHMIDDLLDAAPHINGNITIMGRWENPPDTLPENVRYIGFVGIDEMYREMSTASVGLCMLNPDSHNTQIATPTRLFSFMRLGVPVVATSGTARTIVETEGCGMVAKPGKLSDAINHIIKTRGEGMAGRSAAIGKFGWENEEKILFEVYQRLEEYNGS